MFRQTKQSRHVGGAGGREHRVITAAQQSQPLTQLGSGELLSAAARIELKTTIDDGPIPAQRHATFTSRRGSGTPLSSVIESVLCIKYTVRYDRFMQFIVGNLHTSDGNF